jgi:hypothetical protein
LPEYTVGTNTYSNVVITATSGDRVLVEYPLGMAAVKIDDLTFAQQEQLLQAGLITGSHAQSLERTINKRDAAKRRAEAKAARGPLEQPELSLESAQEQSMADLFVATFKYQAEANNVELELEPWIETHGKRIVYGVFGVAAFFLLLKAILYFRICKKATGSGSPLVFLPVLHWLPLFRAAGMNGAWLLIPLCACSAMFLPPTNLHQFTWAPMAWLAFTGVLWFAAAIVYLIWCVRICRAVDCSGWLAIFLLLPVLDYLALLILAFSNGGGSESAPAAPRLKKPVLAV